MLDEASCVFENKHLIFAVSPLPNPGKYPSAIEVFDKFKKWSTLYPAFLDFDSPEPSSLETISEFPFDKLKYVLIGLDLPDPDDPGQLIRMFNSLVWLVDLLGRAQTTCRHIFVRVSPKHLVHWLSGPGTIIDGYMCLDEGLDNPTAGFMKIILPLGRLRKTCLKFIFPRDTRLHEPVSRELHSITAQCCSDEDFGTSEWRIGKSIDDSHAMAESSVAAYFDLVLDNLSGPCASSLRLERFAYWGTGYKSNHLRRYWGHFGVLLFHDVLGGIDWPRAETEFTRRCRAMHAFNPLSWRVLHGMPDSSATDEPDFEADEELCDVNQWSHDAVPDSRDGWSVAAWFEAYGAQGIPPSASEEYQTQVLRFGPPPHHCQESCEYLYQPWRYKRRLSILYRPAAKEPDMDYFGEDLDRDCRDPQDSDYDDESVSSATTDDSLAYC